MIIQIPISNALFFLMNNLFLQFSVDERTEHVHNIPVIHSIKQNDLQNKIKTATVKKKKPPYEC